MKKLQASVLIIITILASPLAYSLEYFQSEQTAHQHCPKDVVVWLNTNRGIWHYKGQRWYANTKYGAFVCRKEAADGDRGTKNGQYTTACEQGIGFTKMRKSMRERLRITLWLAVVSIIGLTLIDTQAIEWLELTLD